MFASRKIVIASVVAISAAFSLPAYSMGSVPSTTPPASTTSWAAPKETKEVASWTRSAVVLTKDGATYGGASGTTVSFAAQTGDLYLQMTITPSRNSVIDAKDTSYLWLDNTTKGSHVNSPSVGVFGDSKNKTGDYVVSEVGKTVSAGDQATAGTAVTVYAHLYKSGASATYNTFDLWTQPNAGSWSELLASKAEATSTVSSRLTSISAAGFRSSNLDCDDSISISNARIYASVTAVPEPETYAMLLAGLGLVAAVARRRRQANQAL